MLKRLFVFSAVLISGLTVSCWGSGGVKIPSPDREGLLLANDKIEDVSVYNEPEHLKARLYGSGGPERDVAAERLALLNTRKSRKIISEVLKSDNDEAVKSLLKALAKYKSDYLFIDEMIAILETGKASLHPYVFAVFSNADEEKVSKAILKELNQPEKAESVRQNLVKGLSFVPSTRSIPFLIGLLSNRKSDLNAEISNTLNILTRQSFATREEWIAWWKVNSKQSREKWLEQSILEYKNQIQEKDKLIRQYSDTMVALKIDILKMRLEQARRLADVPAEISLLTSALDDKAIMLKKYILEQIKTLDKEKTKQILPRLREEITAYKPSASAEPAIEEYRTLLFDILGDLGDESSIDLLLGILNNSKESAVIKTKVVIALRRIKNPRVISSLLEMVDRESPEIVVVIVETIGTFGSEGKPAVAKFHECIKSIRYQNDEKLIKSVIDALGDIKDPSSAPEIMPFINDARPRVRWSTSNSLGKIGVSDIAPQMVKLLSDEFMDVRQITIESLGKLGNKAAGPDIIKILINDKDSRTRQLSAEALGKIKDTSGIPSLIITLSEKDEKLADSAWNAILSITNDNLDLVEGTVAKLREVKLMSYAIQMLKKITNNQQFKAEELKPRILLDRGILGLLLVESGEYNEAEQYLKDFADNPEYTPALIECYTKLQKYDQALKSSADLLEKQQEYSPQWWSTKFQQFSLYLLQKEYRKIIDEITKLLAKNSLTPEMKERLEKAKDEAQNALTPPAPVNNQPPNPK
ncbi:MAG TPA: HEAT repeat domain-containing protein [Planctomycetota bacterium]|nr:HEAT repeat domain-containing protein [Planctomycetota bacterium]